MDPSAVYARRSFSFTAPDRNKVMDPNTLPGLAPNPDTYEAFNFQKTAYTVTLDQQMLPKKPVVSYNPSNLRLVERVKRLNQMKDEFGRYDNGVLRSAINRMNPYRNLGNSIFMNRAAVKMANIDAIFNVSKFDGNIANLGKNFGDFYFLDIAAGPGGFTQYLQWRRAEARGMGMTLTSMTRNGNLDWRVRDLDMSRFTILNGPDGTGNLYIGWQELIDRTRTNFSFGVDLVMADGGIDTDSPELAPLQEFLSSRLIAVEILVALKTIKQGGDFVLKIFSSYDLITANLLLVLNCSFEEMRIFKPVSSRPANSERYVICKSRRDPSDVLCDYMIRTLTLVVNKYEDFKYLNGFFKEMPPQFVSWLDEQNDLALQRETQMAQDILHSIHNVRVTVEELDMDRLMLIWSVPSTPIDRLINMPDIDEVIQAPYTIRMKRTLMSKGVEPGKIFSMMLRFAETGIYDQEFAALGITDMTTLQTIEHKPLESKHEPGKLPNTTSITTEFGTTTNMSTTEIDHLVYNYGLEWKDIYQLIDLYEPYGFISANPREKANRIDALSSPFTNGGNTYCSIFKSPGSHGNFFTAFPDALPSDIPGLATADEGHNETRRWFMWLFTDELMMTKLNDRFVELETQGKLKNIDMIIYAPYWPQIPLLQTLGRMVQGEILNKKDFLLYDYANARDVPVNIDYIRFHIVV